MHAPCALVTRTLCPRAHLAVGPVNMGGASRSFWSGLGLPSTVPPTGDRSSVFPGWVVPPRLVRHVQATTAVQFVDCRFSATVHTARHNYEQQHLPAAVWFDNEVALPQMPDAIALGQWLLSSGRVRPHDPIVLYDDDGLTHAPRMFLLLKLLGASNVAVLEGGLTAWCAAGGPTQSSQESAPAARVSTQATSAGWATTYLRDPVAFQCPASVRRTPPPTQVPAWCRWPDVVRLLSTERQTEALRFLQDQATAQPVADDGLLVFSLIPDDSSLPDVISFDNPASRAIPLPRPGSTPATTSSAAAITRRRQLLGLTPLSDATPPTVAPAAPLQSSIPDHSESSPPGAERTLASSPSPSPAGSVDSIWLGLSAPQTVQVHRIGVEHCVSTAPPRLRPSQTISLACDARGLLINRPVIVACRSGM
jgi:rhodanese-related sulfurtransferase